mgnify:CR=1 FL=1
MRHTARTDIVWGRFHLAIYIPEVGLSVCVVHALGDVLAVLAVSQTMHSSLANSNCRAGILTPWKDEVGCDVCIFEQSHGDELVILRGLRVL